MVRSAEEVGGSLLTQWCEEQLQEVARAERPARSGAETPSFSSQEFRSTQLLTVEFTDGSVLFTSPEQFAAGLQAVPRSTGADNGRIELPFTLTLTERQRGGEAGGAATVQRYRLTRLVEPTTLDRLYKLGARLDAWLQPSLRPPASALAARMALQICGAYENAVLQRREAPDSVGGLMAWSPSQGWKYCLGKWAENLPEKSRLLLFLHGTASSTQGSFGKLWKPQGDGNLPPTDFVQACSGYAQVVAFEHRSLTASPVENAIELLDQLESLPRGAELDVASHSRGGLIGELLCMLSLDSDTARLEARQAFAAEYGQSLKGQPHPELARIGTLFDRLKSVSQRGVRVRSFVRVACPARGTLLADSRTDLFLSLLVRAAGLALGANGTPAYEALVALARSLVAARADAQALPGLEAMIPGSPLTQALNLHGITVGGRLRVIAGDVQARGLGGLLALLGDVFYGLHDHDYVVHTRSMFGGLQRSEEALSLRIENPSVSHFNYFRESASRTALFNALANNDRGFASMVEDEARTRGLEQLLKSKPRSRWTFEQWYQASRKAELRNRPVLVVLPGIMGSELSAAANSDQRVWLSMKSMRSGNLRMLQYADDGGRALQASGLVPNAYEQLLVEASKRYRVFTFAYDWRRPIQESADGLVKQLKQVLTLIHAQDSGTGAPVYLLAHSMGGLVARWACFHHEDKANGGGGKALWTELRNRGSRLLMLGTPNAGSYAPVRALLQQHPGCNFVGKWSRQVTAEDVATWASGFPGLLQMLPNDDTEYGPLLKPGTWRRMQSEDGATRLPPDQVLSVASSFRAALSKEWEAVRSDERVLYVAGEGLTDVALRMPAQGRRITLKRDWCGDGTVSWQSVPNEERAWYVSATHGDLADTASAFTAYFELLEHGDTKQLRRQPSPPPSALERGVAAVPAVFPESALQPASLPDDDDVAAWVLGLAPKHKGPVPLPPIEVRVVFGSLDYARFPLLLGHYINDRIVSAEKRVDEKLGGQLSQLLALNLYPGALKTSVYVRPNCSNAQAPAYPGAIIVGLGNVGETTPATLAETVARGILRYAFEHRHRDPFAPKDTPEDLRLSTLLIGSHAQAMTLRDSLTGVLQGIWRAATLLSRTEGLHNQVRIREVEVVEMWEHRALEAAGALRQLLTRPDWQRRLHWPRPVLDERDGGMCGFEVQPDRDWWQRLIVRRDDLGGLSYAFISEKARVESTRVQSAIAGLPGLIEGAPNSSQAAMDSSEFSRDLYEMLLPHDLKQRMANFDNTVLLVDDHTALYPWELMAPPRPHDDTGEDELKPLAVQAGLVRQRLTEDYRGLPQLASDFNVLVVSDPCTDGWKDQQGRSLSFVQLGGAEREARALVQRLRTDERRWNITELGGSACQFDTVRFKLHARPYRLLHLCGHGVVDQWQHDLEIAGTKVPVKKTGMVLSRQQLLGADEIQQMSSVPELVFINCCYSGRDGQAGQPMARHYPRLASSLALQFMRMGAKAVVAAGWPVDDEAAALFAERFYAEILGHGRTFGQAVHAARQAVYDAFHERTNTWGAYQCYGDPMWSLEGVQRSMRASDRPAPLLRLEHTMSHRELAMRIHQIGTIAGDKAAAELHHQLDAVVTALEQDPLRQSWLRSTGVCAALGEAYREVGAHAHAVHWFQEAAAGAYSRLQLRHVELMANSLSRSIPEHDAPHTRKADASKAATRARTATRWLASMPEAINGDRLGTAGSELRAIDASIHLREALAAKDTGRRGERLRHAALGFAQAYALKSHLNDYQDRQTYALSNFMLCTGLAALCEAPAASSDTRRILDARIEEAHSRATGALKGLSDARPVPGSVQQWLDEASQRCRSNAEFTTFWDYANQMDLAVARALFGALSQPRPRPTHAPRTSRTAPPPQQAAQERASLDALLDEALHHLEGVLIRWPSPREMESLLARFELLRVVLTASQDAGLKKPDGRRLMDFVEQARTRLAAHRADGY